MKPEERSKITNGIWLCQKCHKMVDSDARRFSVEVLHRWKRQHEEEILEEIGMNIGDKEYRRHIQKVYADESPTALQIALDQPEYWEYFLIVELLRSKFEIIKEEIRTLEPVMDLSR